MLVLEYLVFDAWLLLSPSFLLSLSYFILCVLSSFSFSTRMVPPCQSGPAQGFFLLKGTFSCPCGGLGVLGLGFGLCKGPRDNFVCKKVLYTEI